MKTITLEEHFVTQSFLEATGAVGDAAPPALARVQPALLDLGAGRIAAMNAGGIDLQVLSLAAIGMEKVDAKTETGLCTEINDELAEAVRANPTRLAGFASLPMKTPDAAAAEFSRCVAKHGFVGALVDGTHEGKFLDDPRFLPVFETAVALGVPVYVHPAPPPPAVMAAYYSGLSEILNMLLSIAGWGWHAELGLHTLRLIVSGLFDKLPELQVVIGHMGEGLPYALARSSGVLSGPAHLRQTVAEYFRTNLHVTTSGYFTSAPLLCAKEVIGLDRMMYSVDYPFSPNTNGQAYLETLTELLTAEEMAALSHGNAERLLRL